MGDRFIGGYQPDGADKPNPPKGYKFAKGGLLTDDEREQIIEELNKHSSDIIAIEPSFENGGRVELKWSMSSCVDDFINILLVNNYKVTVYLKENKNDKPMLGRKPENIAVVEYERVER